MSSEQREDPLLRRAVKIGKKFQNPVPTTIGGAAMALRILPRYIANRAETEPKQAPGPFRTDTGAFRVSPASGMRITWFGHSSVLYEIDGVRVLVDPVWDQRASPVRWAGPRRFFPPTCELDELPAADAVLITHDHYDHFGADSIRALAAMPGWERTRWVTMLGVGAELVRQGVRRDQITELDWTESAEIVALDSRATLRIDAWPARHFSGRSIFNRFETLWGSFVLSGMTHRIYHGADSGAWPGFAPIAAGYDGFDLIALEIGAYDPLWAAIHLGPDAALDAFVAMRDAMHGASRTPLFFPIHWGLFNLALHAWRQPIERCEALVAEIGVPLWSPQPGVPTEPDRAYLSDWWRPIR